MSHTLDDIDTPAVVIDLDVMEQNISRMSAYCKKHGLKLRPHVKTHKTVDIARLQMEAGACGIACQKVGEAEVMIAGGLTDVLVCYNIVGEQKLVRLRNLASRATLSVALDSSSVADGISWAAGSAGTSIGVLIELDIGGARTGVQSPKAALDLARHILKLRGLKLLGLLIYPSTPKASPHLDETVTLLEDDGIPVSVVSGGGTTTAFSSHQVARLNEVRVGNYVFNDMIRVRAGVATPAQCALRVLVTVVSVPSADRAVIDGGWKTFTNDVPPVPGEPAGLVERDAGLQLIRMTEEHGMLETRGIHLKVGDKLNIIPNHACGVVNLHEQLIAVRGANVENIWEVRARGKTQ